jgi:hypothetical protein
MPYGGVYFDAWYRRFEQVGRLWLQKATHDFDYLNQFVDARPVKIAAMMTQRVFGTGRAPQPVRPPSHGVQKEAKDDASRVPENITDRNAQLSDHGSHFHAAIRNQDAGSAIIWYANGMVVSYDQNFVTHRSAGSRGAIITGYNGILSWDWMPTERLRIVDHDSPRVDNIECPAEGGHGGGDLALHRAFVDVIQGRTHSAGNLTDGMLSVAMCLAARRAAQRHTVEPIPDFGNFPESDRVVDPALIEVCKTGHGSSANVPTLCMFPMGDRPFSDPAFVRWFVGALITAVGRKTDAVGVIICSAMNRENAEDQDIAHFVIGGEPPSCAECTAKLLRRAVKIAAGAP